MGRTKLDKNLSIFEKLEANKTIDYSEYSVKQLSEVIEELYQKYIDEKKRKVSITDLKNAQKLAVKIATTLEKMIPTEAPKDVIKQEPTDAKNTTKDDVTEESAKDNENTGDTPTENATEEPTKDVTEADK